MKFKEMPGKAMEAVGNFTEAQLEARRQRIASPEFQASIDATRNLMKENLRDAGKHALLSVFNFAIATPVLTAWGLVKGPWDTLTHNMATKNPAEKDSYIASLFTGPLKGFFSGLGSGTEHSYEAIKNLSAAAGRKTVIGARHIVGS